MAHDVFLSYSSKDKPIADAVCGTLEGKKIRCWIAPRDVLPGVPYGEALVEAIEASRVMVLVFSSSANKSPQVMREVERAVSKGMPLIPLRIEQVPPSKSLEYFISAPHWLDALTPPLEKHLQSLSETVLLLLARHSERSSSGAGKSVDRPGTVGETSEKSNRPSPPKKPATTGAPDQSRKWLTVILAAVPLVAVLLVVIIGYAKKNGSSPPHDTAPTATNSIGTKPSPNTAPTVVTAKRASRLPIVAARYPNSEMWESKLKQVIDYSGVNDQKATLADELDHLAKKFGLKFEIDDRAFEIDQLKEVGRTPIADPTPIPKMHASIAEVIEKILKTVPSPSGNCVQIRNDHILITTPFFQRVTVESEVESVPLWEVLDYIEDNFHFGIDRTVAKDKENKSVRIVATNEVELTMLIFRFLKQVGVDTDAARHAINGRYDDP